MAEPIGSFSGLASGVQWRDLVDQLMTIEAQRKLDPVTARQTLAQKQIVAWSSLQSLATKFRDASKALRDGAAFSTFKVSGGASATRRRRERTSSTS